MQKITLMNLWGPISNGFKTAFNNPLSKSASMKIKNFGAYNNGVAPNVSPGDFGDKLKAYMQRLDLIHPKRLNLLSKKEKNQSKVYLTLADERSLYYDSVVRGASYTVIQVMSSLFMRALYTKDKEKMSKLQKLLGHAGNIIELVRIIQDSYASPLYFGYYGRWKGLETLKVCEKGTIGQVIRDNLWFITWMYGELGNALVIEHYRLVLGEMMNLPANDDNLTILAQIETQYWQMVWAKTVEDLKKKEILKEALELKEIQIITIGAKITWKERLNFLNLMKGSEEHMMKGLNAMQEMELKTFTQLFSGGKNNDENEVLDKSKQVTSHYGETENELKLLCDICQF